MIDVTATIEATGSSPQCAIHWRRASAIRSLPAAALLGGIFCARLTIGGEARGSYPWGAHLTPRGAAPLTRYARPDRLEPHADVSVGEVRRGEPAAEPAALARVREDPAVLAAIA